MNEPTRIKTEFQIPEGLKHRWGITFPGKTMAIVPEPPNTVALHKYFDGTEVDGDTIAAASWMIISMKELREICEPK